MATETTSTTTAEKPRHGSRSRLTGLPAILTQPQAWTYVGLSRSEWFRLKSANQLPPAVYIGTSPRPRYRRSDLDRWVEKLKSTRCAV